MNPSMPLFNFNSDYYSLTNGPRSRGAAANAATRSSVRASRETKPPNQMKTITNSRFPQITKDERSRFRILLWISPPRFLKRRRNSPRLLRHRHQNRHRNHKHNLRLNPRCHRQRQVYQDRKAASGHRAACEMHDRRDRRRLISRRMMMRLSFLGALSGGKLVR